MKSWIFLLTLSLSLAACQSKSGDKTTATADSTKTNPDATKAQASSSTAPEWVFTLVSPPDDANPRSTIAIKINQKTIMIDTVLGKPSILEPGEYSNYDILTDSKMACITSWTGLTQKYCVQQEGENLKVFRNIQDEGDYGNKKWYLKREIKAQDLK